MELTAKIVRPLLEWYGENRRELPWRRDREPYHVWLSEIMLQQTRVEAVRGYYARFLAELPDIAALAACDGDRLHKLWEGLGYYSRVRNLQKAAQKIMTEHGGEFPRAYAAIRALPGIGDYTAGAIASICFDAPTPAVDGNVLRVVARMTADERPVDTPAVKKAVTAALEEIYPEGACAEFTQALMEVGAMVCVPNGAPRCGACPLAEFCRSREGELWRKIPAKKPKKAKKEEEVTVFFLSCENLAAVRKRPEEGLLAGLWELPNVAGKLTAQEALDQVGAWDVEAGELVRAVERTHVFTHIIWHMRCYYVRCQKVGGTFLWVDEGRFGRDISLPTAFRMFWERP